MKCDGCGRSVGVMNMLNASIGGNNYCDDCRAKREVAKVAAEAKAEADRRAIKAAAADVLVTTTHGIDGFRIAAYLGVESVEYVIGTGLFSEAVADVQDLFGARSSPFEKKLHAAKKWAFDMLKLRAAEAGANAVVGIDLDYTEFSGNRVALIVNGTLVQVVADR